VLLAQSALFFTSARICEKIEGMIGVEKGSFFNTYPRLIGGITQVKLL